MRGRKGTGRSSTLRMRTAAVRCAGHFCSSPLFAGFPSFASAVPLSESRQSSSHIRTYVFKSHNSVYNTFLCTTPVPQLWRLFQSSGKGELETPGAILSDGHDGPLALDGLRILLSRESPEDPAQYYTLTWTASNASGAAAGASGDGGPALTTQRVQITDYPHPHPQLRAPPKQVDHPGQPTAPVLRPVLVVCIGRACDI